MFRDQAKLPNRQSRRANFHNYKDAGSFFVTINARDKEPFFDIPELNAIATQVWSGLPARFPGLRLDQFVVMSNHIHFIVHLPGEIENTKSFSLGNVVGAYKSLISHHWLAHIATLGPAGTTLPGQIWQRNYYDRIIRNQQELLDMRKYIRNNPLKG